MDVVGMPHKSFCASCRIKNTQQEQQQQQINDNESALYTPNEVFMYHRLETVEKEKESRVDSDKPQFDLIYFVTILIEAE